jgi:hypothetical protein
MNRPKCANPLCNFQVALDRRSHYGKYRKYCANPNCRKDKWHIEHRSAKCRTSIVDQLRQIQGLLGSQFASLENHILQMSERLSEGPTRQLPLLPQEGPQREVLALQDEADLLEGLEVKSTAGQTDKAHYGWTLNWRLWLMSENNDVDACLTKFGDEAIEWGIKVGMLPHNAMERRTALLNTKANHPKNNAGGFGSAKPLANSPLELPGPDELEDLDLALLGN